MAGIKATIMATCFTLPLLFLFIYLDVQRTVAWRELNPDQQQRVFLEFNIPEDSRVLFMKERHALRGAGSEVSMLLNTSREKLSAWLRTSHKWDFRLEQLLEMQSAHLQSNTYVNPSGSNSHVALARCQFRDIETSVFSGKEYSGQIYFSKSHQKAWVSVERVGGF